MPNSLLAVFFLICVHFSVAVVEITPDQIGTTSIQDIVDQNPAGTTYYIKAGVYQFQTISPKV